MDGGRLRGANAKAIEEPHRELAELSSGRKTEGEPLLTESRVEAFRLNVECFRPKFILSAKWAGTDSFVEAFFGFSF